MPAASARDRRPQRDRVHPLALLVGLEHDRERARHEHRGARCLDHARGDQQAEGGCGSAQRRGEREQQQREREHPPAPEQVSELAASDQEGGEHDVVSVEHP